SVTSAARSIKLLQAPVAIADRVPVEQGTTTMAVGAPEPEAGGAIQSSLANTRICPGAAPVYSVRKACMACGLAGSTTSVSVAVACWAELEIRKCTSRSSCTRQSSRRRPYWAPEAPVIARVMRGEAGMVPSSLLILRATVSVGSLLLRQRLGQLAVQAAEAAVAHDHHLGAGRHEGSGARDDGLQRIADHCRHRAGSGRGTQVPAQVRRRVPDHLVGLGHRLRQTVAVRAQFHGIGARLDDGHDRRIADILAQAVQGGGDG